jgi:PIN domain nuclease of toxin-antitoxin system
MKLLLDTHSFLWFIDGNPRLSQHARQLIEDLTNERWLSIASLWELAIKHSMGRLTFAQPFAMLIPEQLQRNDIQILDITVTHLDQITKLPFHHRDPFDRMLIAQALADAIPIIGVDSAFDAYGITLLW